MWVSGWDFHRMRSHHEGTLTRTCKQGKSCASSLSALAPPAQKSVPAPLKVSSPCPDPVSGGNRLTELWGLNITTQCAAVAVPRGSRLEGALWNSPPWVWISATRRCPGCPARSDTWEGRRCHPHLEPGHAGGRGSLLSPRGAHTHGWHTKVPQAPGTSCRALPGEGTPESRG